MRDVNRVVVTGLGAVSPIGQTVGSYWASLKHGVCGIGPITQVPTPEELTQKVAAEVKDFDPLKHFDERQISMLDRIAQFAVVAAREAIAQSAITFDMPLSVRTATVVGVGVGGQTTHDDSFRRIYREKKTRVFPLTIPKLMVNASASQVSMHCAARPSWWRAPAPRRRMRSGLPSTWCGPARSTARSLAARKPASPSVRYAAGRQCG